MAPEAALTTGTALDPMSAGQPIDSGAESPAAQRQPCGQSPRWCPRSLTSAHQLAVGHRPYSKWRSCQLHRRATLESTSNPNQVQIKSRSSLPQLVGGGP